MRIIAGITEDDEIYILEVEFKDRKRYFSMSADTVRPVTYNEAKDLARNLWESYFWDKEAIDEMNERMGTDFKEPEEAAEYVLAVDGELHGFDNSLVPDMIDYKGREWLFESLGSGQNIQAKLKHYFINPNNFKKLIKIWDEYHLKEQNPPDFPDIPEQDWEGTLKKAIDILRPEVGHLK